MTWMAKKILLFERYIQLQPCCQSLLSCYLLLDGESWHTLALHAWLILYYLSPCQQQDSVS